MCGHAHCWKSADTDDNTTAVHLLLSAAVWIHSVMFNAVHCLMSLIQCRLSLRLCLVRLWRTALRRLPVSAVAVWPKKHSLHHRTSVWNGVSDAVLDSVVLCCVHLTHRSLLYAAISNASNCFKSVIFDGQDSPTYIAFLPICMQHTLAASN